MLLLANVSVMLGDAIFVRTVFRAVERAGERAVDRSVVVDVVVVQPTG